MTRRIPAAHIGSILMMDFSSSTLCTVASRHRFGGSVVEFGVVTTAALSSHLKMLQTYKLLNKIPITSPFEYNLVNKIPITITKVRNETRKFQI